MTTLMGYYGFKAKTKAYLPGKTDSLPIPSEPLAKLGKQLFFDSQFSKDHSISCASCHRPELAFADGQAKAQGIGKQMGTRNTPSLLNAAYTTDKFWDGRRPNLTEQVLDPFVNSREHGLQDTVALLARFQKAEEYTNSYTAALGKPLTQASATDIANALSAYITFLKPAESRLSLYLSGKNTTALTEAERQGLELFRGSAHCADCHTLDRTAPLTDGGYHSRGIGLKEASPKIAALVKALANMPLSQREQKVSSDPEIAALGRFNVTLAPEDIGKFKTPSLHHVAETAPYMHDGSLPTLEAVLDWELYYRGEQNQPPLALSKFERESLLSFLKALSAPNLH